MMLQHAQIKQYQQQWQTYWQSRTLREQRMLLAALVVVLGGLIYALVYDPAVTGRARLNKELPALRNQAAEMAGLAKQAQSLKAVAKPVNVPFDQVKDALIASLNRQSIKAIVTQEGEQIHMEIAEIPFAKWLDWLREAQPELGITVSKAQVKKLDTPPVSPGVVNVACWFKSATDQ